jgi:type IV secretion system protein TrbL
MTSAIFDDITAAFLSALTTGAQNLTRYAVPLLAALALIHLTRSWWPVVVSGGPQLGEALGQLVFLLVGIGFYYWLVLNLLPMAQAALATAVQWGLESGGSGMTAATLQQPSFILDAGFVAAAPLAEFDTWWKAVKSTVKLATNPIDALGWCAIVLAFMAVALHHMMMLIEFQLAVTCAVVLLPWGIWQGSASVGEFTLGWLLGGLIRALVSLTMVGIGVPLFEMLRPEPKGFFGLYETFVMLGGSFVFAVLCWIIPARAATMAGRATLSLTGSTLTNAAMTTTRFAMMTSGAVRGTSQLIRSLRG